jgi:hypothetical protein
MDLKLRWGFETAVDLARALKLLTEEFAETKANKQTLGEVDSRFACCLWVSLFWHANSSSQKLFSQKRKRPK